MFYRLHGRDISSNRKECKVEPKKIKLQPVNMDSLQLQASTFLYFFILLHILLNTKRKAVNFTPWRLRVTHHLRQPLYFKKNELQENFKKCTHFGE